jgi:hypothetical protein
VATADTVLRLENPGRFSLNGLTASYLGKDDIITSSAARSNGPMIYLDSSVALAHPLVEESVSARRAL